MKCFVTRYSFLGQVTNKTTQPIRKKQFCPSKRIPIFSQGKFGGKYAFQL